MATARMNRRQRQRVKRRNRSGYIAPPAGKVYVGKPVLITDRGAVEGLLKGLMLYDSDLSPMEVAEQGQHIETWPLDSLKQVLIANGFKVVKRKELRYEKVRTNQAQVPSGAGIHPGQAANPGGAGQVEYITRLTR